VNGIPEMLLQEVKILGANKLLLYCHLAYYMILLIQHIGVLTPLRLGVLGCMNDVFRKRNAVFLWSREAEASRNIIKEKISLSDTDCFPTVF